jgi:FtsP/CotA-like multicopper oxidase with cupredoxin domain
MTPKPSRRTFLGTAGILAGGALLSKSPLLAQAESPADYTLTIATNAIEIAPDRILSVTTYNGQFPGPLLRFKEGQQVTVDIHNNTDTPEQLHWHGQTIPVDVDGSAEEGTPFIAPHDSRRIVFTPRPAGFRFYHTHVRAGANLSNGQYSGLVGPVYIEPKDNPGAYDREVFLTMKEFQPTLSRGGDMAQDFLAPPATVKDLKDRGESAMQESLAHENRTVSRWAMNSSPSTERCSARASPSASKKANASSSTSSTAAPLKFVALLSPATPSP